MGASLLDEYLPADVPSGEIDPRELERARALAMMRMGLGMAGREPMGSAAGGAMKAYIGAQANARQQMVAQLTAYKTRQEIAAKAKAAAQEQKVQQGLEDIWSKADLPDAGGPTEANLTLMTIRKLEANGAYLYRQGKEADATKAFQDADRLKEKYFPTPQWVRGADGKPRLAQLSERGNPKVLEGLTPIEEPHYLDVGGSIQSRGKMTGDPLGPAIPKTMTFADRNAAANQNLAERRFAFDKENAEVGAPVQAENGFWRIPKKGEATPVTIAGSGGTQLQAPVAATVKQAIAQNNVNIRLTAEMIAGVKANKGAFGLKNLWGDTITQRMDPGGVAVRAKVANLGSLKFHDRSGANVTAKESPRLTPFIPSVDDEADVIVTKAEGFQRESILMNQELLSGKPITEVAGIDAAAGGVPPDIQEMIRRAEEAKKARGGAPQ